MAHPVGPADRRDREARRQPPRGGGRGPKRFLGPAILGVVGVAILAFVAPRCRFGATGPDGRVGAATGVPSPAAGGGAAAVATPTAPPCDHGDVFTGAPGAG